MSTELKAIEQNGRSNEVSVTSFFGGKDRGRCLQLTQTSMCDQHRSELLPWQVIQMDKQQVEEAIAIMQAWLWESK